MTSCPDSAPRPLNAGVDNARLYQQMIAEVADFAIIRIDPNGKIQTWNLGAERIKGYCESEILGLNFRRFYTDADRAAGKPDRLLDQARREGRAHDEGWRVRKDGSGFWASVVITALHDDQGQTVGYTKVTRDLTERKRVEESLRRSEERFQRMVEEVSDYAILMLDTSGHVETWNSGARLLKGYTADEIIGQHFSRFYLDSDRAADKPSRLLAEAREHGRAQDEGWRLRKNGTRFWASVTITALHDQYAEIVGFTKVTRDLTERMTAETRLKTLAEKLQFKNAELEQFAYITSHDLQEPLRTVASYSKLMQRRYGTQLDADATEWLGYVTEAVGRMSRMIDDLLQHSRIGRDSNPEPVNLSQVAAAVCHDLQALVAKRGARIRTGELPTVQGMPTELRRLLQNLVGNALKFVPADRTPEVEIWAEKRPGAWCIYVQDNGIGIDPEQTDRIFRIFQRLNTREEFEGTGMGLAHCQKIIESHQGTIGVEPAPENGSRFYFTLPE